jgi:hypothetical protein
MADVVENLALTRKWYGNAKASREVTKCTPTEVAGMVASPTLVLSHYLRYLEIQPPDDLCIASYCDNSSLLIFEEGFHTRDIDSSTLYTKPNHDVTMTLSALRTNLPLRLASLHVRGNHNEKCDFDLLFRPTHFNVPGDHFATDVITDLRAADKSTEISPLPACRVYLRHGTGSVTGHKKRTLTIEFPEYELLACGQQLQIY